MMYAVVVQAAGTPATVRVCEEVKLKIINGGWLECTGFPYEPDCLSCSINLNTVKAIYEVSGT